MRILFTIAIVLSAALLPAQSKLPAIFYNFDKFYAEFSKLEGYTSGGYSNVCYKSASWDLKTGNDTFTISISVSGSKVNPNQIQRIGIYMRKPEYKLNPAHDSCFKKVMADIDAVVNDKNFSDIALFHHVNWTNEFYPEAGLYANEQDIYAELTDTLGNKSNEYGCMLSISTEKERTLYDDLPEPDGSKNLELRIPRPEIPDSNPPRPYPFVKYVNDDYNYIKPFAEKLLGGEFVVDSENESDINYKINTNPGFDCHSTDTLQSNISFTILGHHTNAGGIYELEYECAGTKPEPVTWAKYLQTVDSLVTFIGAEKPVIFTNENVKEYNYVGQRVYPIYNKVVSYSFLLFNCPDPCGTGKKYFTASVQIASYDHAFERQLLSGY